VERQLDDSAWKLIDYLTFKMQCASEQELTKWKLDVELTQSSYDEIMALKDEKVSQLAEAMPRKQLTKVATQPKIMYKKNGDLSELGHKWFALCKENKQPKTSVSFVVKVGEKLGNPISTNQVKDWLYSLGWQPRTFNFVRDKGTGDERKIEQVRKDGELCESVLELSEADPAVDVLDGLVVLTHRAAILKGFLDSHKGGYLKAGIAGFANTFRFKHKKPLANLPSVDKPYGKIIRGVLTCEEGEVLCGSDMISLESTTKRHYMFPYDPDYVEEMSQEGFDEHLDLAKQAGVVTQQDIDEYNQGKRPDLKGVRKKFKPANYAGIYGIGGTGLSRQTGMPVKECVALLEAYWKRNWSVKKVADGVITKELFGTMWLLNPVSGFWHQLRAKKDIFSTLNQSTGVYCFDTWVGFCMEGGMKLTASFHDEVVAGCVVKGDLDMVLKVAMDKANEKLKLNVKLGHDTQYGKNYAEIH